MKSLDTLIKDLLRGKFVNVDDYDWTNLYDDLENYPERILVASLGKPGYGILERYDPELYMSYDMDFTIDNEGGLMGIFPIRGPFDFNMAADTVKRYAAESAAFMPMFVAFWMYHGTPRKFAQRFERDRRDIVARNELIDGLYMNPVNEIFWNVPTPRIKMMFATTDIRLTTEDGVEIHDKANVAAPLPIISLIAEATNDVPDVLLRWSNKKITKMYTGNRFETRPLAHVQTLWKWASRSMDVRVDDEQRGKLVRRLYMLLSVKKQFNPSTLTWLGQLDIVQSAGSLDLVDMRETKGEGRVLADEVLVSVTPGIEERVEWSVKRKRLVDKTRKKTRERIDAAVMSLHGSFPEVTMKNIIRSALPWELVWLGVDGKGRTPGKVMGRTMQYIDYVIGVVSRSKGSETYERVTKVARSSTGVETSARSSAHEEEMVAKLSKFFRS